MSKLPHIAVAHFAEEGGLAAQSLGGGGLSAVEHEDAAVGEWERLHPRKVPGIDTARNTAPSKKKRYKKRESGGGGGGG